MPNYVDTNYSSDYVEGDTPSADTTIQVVTNEDIQQLKADNVILKDDNVFLKSEIASLKTMLLSISSSIANLPTSESITLVNDNISAISSSIANLPTSESITLLDDNISAISSNIVNLPTQEYINTKIPLVDDMSVKVFPVGTKVKVAGFSGVCEVISSSYLPSEEFTYFLIYTVSYSENGVTKISNFPANQVVLYVPESV